MKEIVTKILDVIMFLVPFFGKRKRNRIVREVRFNATHKEVCNVKTTEREKDDELRRRFRDRGAGGEP